MKSLGAKLRLERERQKLGIEKIAEDTRIGLRYLQAIEADDQTSLPGEFFYRAFVRQYSKYLGWDPDEIEKQINMVSSLASSEPVEPAAAPNGSLNITTDGQISALRESLKHKPMMPAQNDGMSRGWLVFAAVVIVACIGYFGWRNFSPAPVETAQTPPVAPVETKPTPAPPPVVQAEVVPPPQKRRRWLSPRPQRQLLPQRRASLLSPYAPRKQPGSVSSPMARRCMAAHSIPARSARSTQRLWNSLSAMQGLLT
jgi:cytoskeletal protein RodZ